MSSLNTIVEDPVQVSDEFALKPLKEITVDDIRNEVINNFEYFRERILRCEFEKIDADPNVCCEEERILLKRFKLHQLTQFSKEISEERARREVEKMRQNRHQKSSVR